MFRIFIKLIKIIIKKLNKVINLKILFYNVWFKFRKNYLSLLENFSKKKKIIRIEQKNVRYYSNK